ncbi:MAG: FMN-binding glutamate synthase family protein [Tetrasphaera sp.]
MRPKVVLSTAVAALGGVAAHDLLQKRHSLMRNFPVIAHARFALETIGPELRQYIVTSNDEERPFSRDQRTWIYASSKLKNNYVGFGTDNAVEDAEYVVFKQHTFSDAVPPTGVHAGEHVWLPCPKVLGGPRGRRDAFRPDSVVNISGDELRVVVGAMRSPRSTPGQNCAGCQHNTGEGGLSPHHRHGGDLILQIGTAYFGCRDDEGRFDLDKLRKVVESAPVRAIEIKLSQGAKPGLGGMLPAAKITEEIAAIRGIPMGTDCASPVAACRVPRRRLACSTSSRRSPRRPGSRSGSSRQSATCCSGRTSSRQMRSGSRGVDFITIDGGEGGTGAAPLVFSDARLAALPGRVRPGLRALRAAPASRTDVVFIGSGKLGLPDNALVAFALGADMVNIAREAMMAIGCIQSQKCHTDHCPTGVATQNTWLAHGLDPTLKSVRLANYIRTLRRDLLKVSEACGVWHPALLDADDVEILDGNRHGTPLREIYGYEPSWGGLSGQIRAEIEAVMSATGPRGGSAPSSASSEPAPRAES